MLQVKNITKSFGGVRAIQGSNFSVQTGKVTALIGPNGAGKTTLFDIIGGYTQPDTGSVYFKKQDITKKPHFARANLGISRTFQQVRLFRYLSIAEHLQMVESNDDTRLLQNMFGKRAVSDSYQRLLDDFGIERDENALASELSYGQRKLLDIMLALQRPHDLLMLDEPVAGVNQVIQDRIERLLLDLKKQKETMLIIDHDMQFVRKLADHVIVLDAGVVLLEGAPQTVLKDPRVLAAYLGE